MANGRFLVSVLLLVFVSGFLPSASPTRQSALTLDLCDSFKLEASEDITIDIDAHSGESRKVAIAGDGSKSHYEVKIKGPSLPREGEYQFEFVQKTIKSVTVTSTAAQVCVKALVVDMIIVVDQPTDFNDTCSSSSPEELERPCKQFGDPIDISKLYVCPERLKELLLEKNVIRRKNRSESTRKVQPPTYDITDDMLQASSAIAAGLTEGAGTITNARQKYREARKAKPLQKLGTFTTAFQTASSFISAIVPFFSVFSGIASIATTFLTPNPFDELANYLDEEFKQINKRLTDIQGGIAGLGRLIEAQGGVLAMAEQLRAIRYNIRNYGVLVDAISSRPVCGLNELSQMPEVKDFMRQYQNGELLTNNVIFNL